MVKYKALLLLILVMGYARAEARPANDNYWRHIARSSQIVVVNTAELFANGITQPIVEITRSGISIMRANYQQFTVKVQDTLKGETQEEITFKIFIDEEVYNYLTTLQQTEQVIVFLVYVAELSSNYLANYFIEAGLMAYTAERKTTIKNEVLWHKQIVEENLYTDFTVDENLYAKVAGYIANTTNSSRQFEAFESLEYLDQVAVPYIILQLNNFNNLAIRGISLRNNWPGAFEGIRHYGPHLVIDALTAILNQITGESFGSIYNGGSHEERLLALNGWRVYLYKLLNN
ncbi:MAG: hypothetical protein FWE37_08850 [Spirochaetaceae bacterium]|nr:hypothetical protein [Spirochaetaceae bacterium]